MRRKDGSNTKLSDKYIAQEKFLEKLQKEIVQLKEEAMATSEKWWMKSNNEQVIFQQNEIHKLRSFVTDKIGSGIRKRENLKCEESP